MGAVTRKKIPTFIKTFILIFAIVASIILIYSIIEINQSKKEILKLMDEQTHSLSESVLTSSQNALNSYEMIDDEMKKRLFNNANLIRLLLEKNQISNETLVKIADENGIHRINVFNSNGEKIYTNHTQVHEDIEEKFNPKDVLLPIFNGITDTLLLGIREARFEDGFRFAIAISGKDRSAIVLNQDAEGLLNFRRSIGFGALLKRLTENYGIIYAMLEDTSGIIAASGNFVNSGNLTDDKFLLDAFNLSIFDTRIIEDDTLDIFEAVHPFLYNDQKIGLLRLGLPAYSLLNINRSNIIRIIILGIILLLLGSSLLAYTFKKQNYEILKKDYKEIESYSNNIIQNVSDSVIVISQNKKVSIFNKAAELLFNKKSDDVIDKKFQDIFTFEIINFLQEESVSISHIETIIGGRKKYLLGSKSDFSTSDSEKNTILVLRDLTQLKKFEEHINRKERLVAMGELASGVAHEIRNPLNTISTISQQLRKDFEPQVNKEEYEMLTMLVSKEINRINDTVKEFLRFSKPEKISLSKFKYSDLINQLVKQYESLMKEKSIRLINILEWDGEVYWDRNQIQQALMNLIQNSYDSLKNNGEISIISKVVDENIIIIIQDNGSGMQKEIQKKIFNLYFTTKAKGTGIGLSMVQRIIIEHNGFIEFESKPEQGTVFTLTIPLNPKLS